MIVMIDNYDSFTYNLVHYLGELGAEIKIFRNDEITLPQLQALQPSHLVISPGPCTPNEAGICMDAIRHFADRLPILGVCLGHEAMAQAFGGNIVHATHLMHGKISPIHHQQQGVFQHIPNAFNATRYHSLIAERASLPDCFDITAWVLDEHGEPEDIMGIQHKHYPMYGVQFHPESIMTEHGHQLLENFLKGSRHGD